MRSGVDGSLRLREGDERRRGRGRSPIRKGVFHSLTPHPVEEKISRGSTPTLSPSVSPCPLLVSPGSPLQWCLSPGISRRRRRPDRSSGSSKVSRTICRTVGIEGVWGVVS